MLGWRQEMWWSLLQVLDRSQPFPAWGCTAAGCTSCCFWCTFGVRCRQHNHPPCSPRSASRWFWPCDQSRQYCPPLTPQVQQGSWRSGSSSGPVFPGSSWHSPEKTAGCPYCVPVGWRSRLSPHRLPFSSGRWCSQHRSLGATWTIFPGTCRTAAGTLPSPPVGPTHPLLAGWPQCERWSSLAQVSQRDYWPEAQDYVLSSWPQRMGPAADDPMVPS